MENSDHRRALAWARSLVQENNWVTLDTETTGFTGQVIEWAVCAPSGEVLGQGLVKPTIPIEDGARLVHHITEYTVRDAPSFAEVWPVIWSLMQGKTVVIWGAEFDIARLLTSAQAHGMRLPTDEFNTRCAMAQYAAYHGERNWRGNGRWKWQKLGVACAQLSITVSGRAHSAAADAQACAAIVRRMAEIAELEQYCDDAKPDLPMREQRGVVELVDLEKDSARSSEWGNL